MTMISRILVILLAVCTSCSDELESVCADPLGTEAHTYQHESWVCFMTDLDACLYVDLATSPVIRSISFQNHVIAMMADVGSFACLRDVPEETTAGFAYGVALVEGHGYVVRFENRYARFFVESLEKNSAGKVIRVNITRQTPPQ